MTIYEPADWRQVPGWPYMVTRNGDVFGVRRGRLLAWGFNRGGYPEVKLHDHGRKRIARVHHLVLEAFVGPRPDGCEARHLDGNRGNPRLDNLAWGTRSENRKDRRAHGTDHNLLKTHCPSGHPYSAENTYLSRGQRQCRICRALSHKKGAAG